jgi:hydroxymethylbilane synthase
MRIGTRGSALALAQARQVAGALGDDAEIVTITTSGDRDRARGDKERWVKEIEEALLDGSIDVAVHSAKDVPAELPPGLALVAAPARADPRDALCGAGSLEALAPGARVGTSSLRRAALLRAAREDLDVAELRGNVDTRLRKLADGEYDAIVLALAGLERLGLGSHAGAVLDADAFVPAAGQGTLAIEARAGDDRVVGALNDASAMRRLLAERALVRALGADCHTPVGAFALEPGGAGGPLRLAAFVGRADGSAWVRDVLDGDEPEALGAEVAARLRAAGADEVLGR